MEFEASKLPKCLVLGGLTFTKRRRNTSLTTIEGNTLSAKQRAKWQRLHPQRAPLPIYCNPYIHTVKWNQHQCGRSPNIGVNNDTSLCSCAFV
ncbi:unnamed protein product [Malus baccata var. baccata]